MKERIDENHPLVTDDASTLPCGIQVYINADDWDFNLV